MIIRKERVAVCRPPLVEDFSKKSVSGAVLNTALQHPATIFPGALGLVGIFGLLVLGPSAWLISLAAGGLCVGTGNCIFNFFFRGDAIAKEYIQKLQERLEDYKQQLRDSAREEFEMLEQCSFASAYVGQGLQQFDMIHEKFENLKEILQSKMNTSELAFTTYFGTAEQVYLAVLDNLKSAALILKSIKSIDNNGYIKNRLKDLKKIAQPTPADQNEIETLNKRKEIYDKKMEEVNALLTQNEEAMTELDATSSALASVKTSESLSSVDVETAMKELGELAKRAQKYSLDYSSTITEEKGGVQ